MTLLSPRPLNVIYSTHTRPDYMPPISLSERQIIVGAGYTTVVVDGAHRSINVPPGRYDLAEIVRSLPPEQSPDLTVVLADATQFCMPTQLAAVPGRKLFLVADTHRGRYPLQAMLDYAREQSFDAIAVTHDPHHLHWFAEAEIAPTTYVPNANVHDFHLPFEEAREPSIIFVGNVDRFHPRRRAVLDAIKAARLPLRVAQAPPLAAAGLYNSTQITINMSLNGDLNMRVFEALSAGAFLVTDRLAPQAGLDQMFERDRHYVDFASTGELMDKLRFYLKAPDECLRIARAGQAAYLRKYAEVDRKRDLLSFAFGGAHQLPFRDRRTDRQVDGFGQKLPERVRVYEFLQERTITADDTVVLVDPALGARILADLVDLPRLQVRVDARGVDLAELARSLQLLGVLEQIEFVGSAEGRYDVRILAAGSLGQLDGGDAALAPGLAVISDDESIAPQQAHLERLGLCPIGGRAWLFRYDP